MTTASTRRRSVESSARGRQPMDAASSSSESEPRGDERQEVRKRTHDEMDEDSKDGGADSLLSSPLKMRRSLSSQGIVLESTMKVIMQKEEALNTRLEYGAKTWVLIRDISWMEMVDFVERRISCFVDLIDVLLHTGYFPLQQLCFMTIASVLCRLQKRDQRLLSALVVICRERLSEEDWELMELLPFTETIAWHDPQLARRQVVKINKKTGTCLSHRVLRCWVSPKHKENLTRLRTDKWLDFGSTTANFYWNDDGNVIVVNVPYSCIDGIEVDSENFVVYIRTKQLDKLGGARLLAFSVTEAEFIEMMKTIQTKNLLREGIAIEADTQDETAPNLDAPMESPVPQRPSRRMSAQDLVSPDVGSPASIHTPMRVIPTGTPGPVTTPASPIAPPPLAAPVSPVRHESPVTPTYSMSLEHSVQLSTSPMMNPVGDSEDDLRTLAVSRSHAILDDTFGTFGSLQAQLDETTSVLTETLSRIRSDHSDGGNESERRVNQVQATHDELQQQQQRLELIHRAEYVLQTQPPDIQSEYELLTEDSPQYASEDLIQDEKNSLVTSATAVLLVVVVVPWILFAFLYVASFGPWRQHILESMRSYFF